MKNIHPMQAAQREAKRVAKFLVKPWERPVSRKAGQLELNPERPCMRVTSKDSKAHFSA